MADWRSLVPAGDGALLIDFGDTMDPLINRAVHQMAGAVTKAKIEGVWGIVPAFSTLLVEFDPRVMAMDHLQGIIRDLPMEMFDETSRCFEIPVCYGGDCGADLLEVAERLDLRPQDVVEQHAVGRYQIYCIGFSPGFPLCGILPESLRLPRRPSPRTLVPAGSVAVAGSQTGIYPTSSPGGWNLLGRTPARLFLGDHNPPVRYQPGDFLTFRPIDPLEYAELEAQVLEGIDVVVEVLDA